MCDEEMETFKFANIKQEEEVLFDVEYIIWKYQFGRRDAIFQVYIYQVGRKDVGWRSPIS